MSKNCEAKIIVRAVHLKMGGEYVVEIAQGEELPARASKGFENVVNREVFTKNKFLLVNLILPFKVNASLEKVH